MDADVHSGECEERGIHDEDHRNKLEGERRIFAFELAGLFDHGKAEQCDYEHCACDGESSARVARREGVIALSADEIDKSFDFVIRSCSCDEILQENVIEESFDHDAYRGHDADGSCARNDEKSQDKDDQQNALITGMSQDLHDRV